MPNYYNPYNFYPASYSPAYGNISYGGPTIPMQQSTSTQYKSMEWVEGEVGAKAFQMPQGWPANQPIPLWDSTDTVIYLKSWSPMGMPNPMQKLHYNMEEQKTLPQGNVSGTEASDMSQYVTKSDFESMKNDFKELKEILKSQGQNNQNGNQNGGRR